MTGSVITDTYWFIRHLYKMDLDKSITKKTKSEEVSELPEIHRRSYKLMMKYFGDQNDQLVLQRHVAEDLRKYLDVDEGIRCLIFGKRTQIPEDKVKFYLAYSKTLKLEEEDNVEDDEKLPKDAETPLHEEDEDEFFNVERIVNEYVTIKQVLINNSFPVDIATLQSGQSFYVGAQSTALNLRLLFDKRIFLDLL